MGNTFRSSAGMSSISWQLTPVVQPTTPLRDPLYVVSPCEASSRICLVMRQNYTEKNLFEMCRCLHISGPRRFPDVSNLLKNNGKTYTAIWNVKCSESSAKKTRIERLTTERLPHRGG